MGRNSLRENSLEMHSQKLHSAGEAQGKVLGKRGSKVGNKTTSGPVVPVDPEEAARLAKVERLLVSHQAEYDEHVKREERRLLYYHLIPCVDKVRRKTILCPSKE